MATHIRIRIGAGLDNSVDTVFDTLRRKAQRAGRDVARELSRGSSAGAAGGAGGRHPVERQSMQAVRAHAQAMRMIERQERERSKVTEREAKRAEQAEHRLFMERLRSSRQAAREAEKLERQKTRTVEREARRRTRADLAAQRAMARRSAAINARMMDRWATRTTHRATRFFWPNAPVTQTMKRVGMDVLRGAGVETNLAGIVGNVVGSQKLAKEISVQAYRPGEAGAPGVRVNPAILAEEARALGENMAASTDEVLRGQKAFVDLQGDLEGARAVSTDLLRLAKGQGVAFEDMMYTAAKANAMFAEQPEYMHNTAKRSAAVYDLMKRLTYEGKVGSIVMDQMAKNFAKVSGMTGLFGGPRMKTAIQLTSLAQMAEAGAASNPRQAMTWINAFVRQLVKNREKIQKFTGVEVIGEGGRMKDPFTIIRQMMVATAGGGRAKLPGYKTEKDVTQAQLLMGAIGGRAQAFLGGLMKAQGLFVAASGGRSDRESIKAGLAALNRDLLKFGDTISETQNLEDFKEHLGLTSSRAQVFNQRLEKLTERALVAVVPALERLEKPALKLAGVFADVFKWAAENPWRAIMAAIAGATVRAAIESSFRAAIEASIYRGTGAIVSASAPAATGLTTVGSQAGFASAGLARVAASTGAFLLAIGAVWLAGEQLNKLIGSLGADKTPPKPGGAADTAKRASQRKWGGAERHAAMATAGMGMAPGASSAMTGGLALASYTQSEKAAAAATGKGESGGDDWAAIKDKYTPFDIGKAAYSSEDVMDKLAAKNWEPKATEKPGEGTGIRVMEASLAAIEGHLSSLRNGIRVSNAEDFKQATPGPGVDNASRDMQ